MSLMASPSTSPSRNYNFNVFASFHGPDVRKTLLSHIREQFYRNGITMFDDQKIERSATIAPSLTEAIKESRISIVILSKKYASSSWCLDELVEILECKKTMGQIVMTIFYGVDPSNVRKQIGEFGVAFDETCACKTDEERQKWSKALKEVGNIAGEDFLRWDNEANMIKKIAKDVSDKLIATPSRDSDGMVGLEAHLRVMESLLDLEYDGVKMVAITGPAGIGKTTIARALQSRVSNRFQLTCFMDNLRESYPIGLDEYGLKLRLQEQFLSKLLNLNGMRICHLGVIEERLCKQKVLIILDDVNSIQQLMALANESTWFGPGSRIVVTTENKELLQQHGINNTYHVGFPSHEQAFKILCRYAFKRSYPYHGFEKHVQRVMELCGKLPLGLSVVGSSLCGSKEDEWEDVISRLENIINRGIEDVLRVGYESLDENEQTLFLHIAVFFNNRDVDLVKSMFADSDLDVKYGLKILENRSLIEIFSYHKTIVMHRLLQQMGIKAIHKQEPWKRLILMHAPEICGVLEDAKGNSSVVGISFDISRISGVSISKKAFKKMPNLRFLRVYKGKYDGNNKMHIPEEMEFPHHLRLLDWEAYPSKSLPPTFHFEYLIELKMQGSQLEYLWQGNQPLKNLKKMDLLASKKLKEIPDLTNATNLEDLNLNDCESLVEIPSSCSHLHKLQKLSMSKCINLEVIPAHMNLASLKYVSMGGCSRLRNIPVMSMCIKNLYISETAVEDVSSSSRLWSCLEYLDISGKGNLKEVTDLPTSVTHLELSNSDIERIPSSIQALHLLQNLHLSGCKRLRSLPKLPGSLKSLMADNCESLETVFFPLNLPNASLNFINCFKLGQQARRAIIQQSFFPGATLLPGREVPVEFDHRGRGNSLTICPDGNPYIGFVFCVVISSNQQTPKGFSGLLCRRVIAQDDGYPVEGLVYVGDVSKCRREHLFIFDSRFIEFYPTEYSREIVYELSSKSQDFDIIECGAKIFTEESIKQSYESGSYQVTEDDIEFEPHEEAFEDNTEYNDITNEELCNSKEDENLDDPTNLEGEKHTDCWSWLFICFGSLVSRRRQ
ncbi:Disease resistance protein RML1B [Cardamine amara subsp. amara]|uniref:ADP-ribosyl cyclase/cyclic ADP-ribose hydrolase n=1 Tax=Cardamine amara subsp. amara TaxID=228776 RepID=A0ABD1C797_CARAN